MSENFAKQLEEAIKSKALSKKDVKNSKIEAKKVLESEALTKNIDPFLDWLFGIGLILAILKDIFDIFATPLIAIGIGEIAIVIFTFFLSVLLAIISILTSCVAGSSGKILYRIGKKLFLILAAFLFEDVPILGLMPWESIITAIIYWMTLRDRRKDRADKMLEESHTA